MTVTVTMTRLQRAGVGEASEAEEHWARLSVQRRRDRSHCDPRLRSQLRLRLARRPALRCVRRAQARALSRRTRSRTCSGVVRLGGGGRNAGLRCELPAEREVQVRVRNGGSGGRREAPEAPRRGAWAQRVGVGAEEGEAVAERAWSVRRECQDGTL
eukprot:1379483-Rhodomonas_salina.1